MEGPIKDYCLYHANCADGAYAALALYMKRGKDACIFIPHSTTERVVLPAPCIEDSRRTLYLLDYCGFKGFMIEACARFHFVVLLDHHKTAQEEIAANVIPLNLVYKINLLRSGCMIALDWFCPPVGLTDELADCFAYVEDHDLYRHKLPESESFTEGLGTVNLQDFDALLTLTPAQLIALGRPIVAARDEYVRRYIATFTVLPNICYGVNMPQHISHIGHVLCTVPSRSHMGIVAWHLDIDRIKVSVRSIGDVDTTVLTKKYDGGGHVNASGCVMTHAQFTELVNSERNGDAE